MKTVFKLLAHVGKADAFSPTAFVVRALIISLLFGISELAGLREYTTFLSGTSANLNVSWQTAATLGLIHLLLCVAFILLVPASLMAAGLLVAYRRWAEGRGRGEKQQSRLTTETLLSSKA
jgi:hypothetical protein